MTALYWQTIGEGERDLVLLHGWGLNAEVWSCIQARLAPHFRLHGRSAGVRPQPGFGALSLEQMTEIVLAAAPSQARWLGWSLGGLVASRAALMQPQRVKGLITVASSPCFAARDEWPGIRPDVLSGFQHQLSTDFQRTVERFLALQTLGTESARQDARQLKAVVLNQPTPSVEVLNGGLEILRTADLRAPLARWSSRCCGFTAIWMGWCRARSPSCSTPRPNSTSQLVAKAAHAPFISHPDEFVTMIEAFIAAH